MGVPPPGMGFSDARRAYITVHSVLEAATAVAAARATDPGAFPLVPQSGMVEWFTRRLMGDLVELGFTPDGWESDYLHGNSGDDTAV